MPSLFAMRCLAAKPGTSSAADGDKPIQSTAKAPKTNEVKSGKVEPKTEASEEEKKELPEKVCVCDYRYALWMLLSVCPIVFHGLVNAFDGISVTEFTCGLILHRMVIEV